MHSCANGNVAQGQAIATLYRRLGSTQHLIAHRQTFRRNDVITLTICIADECDIGRSVRVVFYALNLGGNAVLVALEIDYSIVLFMTTTNMARGNVPIIITTCSLLLGFSKSIEGTPFIELIVDNLNHATTTWRCRLYFNECHYLASSVKLIS
jgi:hypothetical protein